MLSPAEWLAGLLASLPNSGPEGAAASNYIATRGVQLSLHRQTTGARWRPGRRIELNPVYLQTPAETTYAISLVIHEVRHLEQGILVALSVYGELEAWHLQFGFLRSRLGHYHEDSDKDRLIADLMDLPTEMNRASLARARKLMREYAGPKYRVDLLPLFPLTHEIRWHFTRRDP